MKKLITKILFIFLFTFLSNQLLAESITLVSNPATISQTLCVNSAITEIKYDLSGGLTEVTVTGLPTGVYGTYNAGVYTINGTPTESGTFFYTISASVASVVYTAEGFLYIDRPASASQGLESNLCSNSTASVGDLAASEGTYLWTHNGMGTLENTTTLSPVYTPAQGDVGYAVLLTLTVTSNNTCPISTATSTFTYNVKGVPSFSGNLYTYVGATSQLNGSPGQNISYPWNCSDASIATIDNNGLVTGVALGSTTIMYYDTNYCSVSQTFDVVTLITPTISGNLTICSGSTSQLIGTETPMANNPWVSSNTSVATVSSSGLVSGISAGTSSITYKNSTGGTSTVNFVVNAIPSVSVNSQTICNGGSTTLYSYPSTLGGTYLWGGNETSANISVSPTSTSNFTVIYTLNGCSSNQGLGVVTVNPIPPVSAGTDITVCSGGSITLNGTGAQTYSWSNGVTNGTSFVPTLGTTSYTLTGISNGCTATDVVVVTVNVSPNLVINNPSPVCSPSTVDITLAVITSGSTGGGTLSYWTDENCTTNLGSPNSIINPGPIFIKSTLGACSDVKQVTVTINPQPIITGNLSTYVSSTTQLTGSATEAVNTPWLSSNSLIATVSSSGLVTGVAAGNVVITYTNTNGCSNTVNVTVGLLNSISLTSTIGSDNQTICVNSTITNITYSTTGATGATFSGLPAGISGNWNTNLVTISGTPSVPGNYNFVVTLTGGHGNITTNGTFNVNSNTTIISQSTANQIQCITTGTFSSLGVNAVGSGSTYQWFSNTVASNSGGILEAGATYTFYTPSSTTAGTLYYYCVVTGTCSTVTTSVSGAIITSAVTTISSQSTANQTQSINTGTFSPLTVNAIGLGLTYQWYSAITAVTSGGTILGSANGAQTASFTPSSTTIGTLYYYCVVTGTCSTATTSVSGAIITNAAPTISGPSTLCVGSTISLTGSDTPSLVSPWVSSNTGIATINSSGIVTGISAGTSVITYANSTGGNATYTVTINQTPVVTFTAQPGSTACIGTDVTYTTQSSMAGYVWTIPGISSTDYTITSGGSVTDNTFILKWLTSGSKVVGINYTSGGCSAASATSSTSTTVNSLPVVTFTAQPGPTACVGADVTYTTQSGKTGYVWTIPGISSTDYTITSGGTATDNTVTLKWLTTATPKVVQLNYTSVGCTAASATSSTSTTINPIPVVTFTAQPVATACIGADVTYTTQSGKTGYVWTIPGILSTDYTITSGGSATDNTLILKWLTSGSKVVGINYTSGGCTAASATSSTSTTVNQSISIASQSTANQTKCLNAPFSAISVTTAAGISLTYQWYSNTTASNTGGTLIGGATSSTYTPSSTAVGTLYYYCEISSLCGTPEKSAISGAMIVNPLPTVTVNSPSICNGSSAILEATPSQAGGTYLWSDSSTGATLTVTPLVTTTYSVVYTLNGCSSSSVSGIVTVNPLPTVTVNSPSICNGSSAILEATPSQAGGTYLWSDSSTGATLNVTPLVTTTYSVVYSLNGCSSSSVSGSVTVNPLPTVTVNSPSICNGSSAMLEATPSQAGGTYLWSDSSTGATLTVTPLVTTTYSVVYSLNGCSSSSVSGSVTVNPLPTVTVNSPSICSGSSTMLEATPSQTGGTYLWSDSSTGSTLTVTPLVTTTYSVVYSLNGCSSSSVSGSVTVDPLPTVTVNSPSICNGSSAILEATPSQAGGTYLWSDSSTGSTLTVTPLVTTTYSVVYTYNGCSSLVIPGVVTVNPSPVLTITNPIPVTSPNTIDITSATITAGSSGGGILTYWINALNTTALVNPTSIAMSGTYFIKSTLGSCSDIQPVTVTINTVVSSPVSLNGYVIPTGVTLNGLCDGSATVVVTSGTAPFTYQFSDNTTASATTNLCAGLKSVIITDANSETLVLEFIISSPDNFISTTTLLDSTIIDSVFNTVITNCVLDYSAITSAIILSYDFLPNNKIQLNWRIISGVDTTYAANIYDFIPNTGVYLFALQLYCPNKAMGMFLTAYDQLYIIQDGSGTVSASLNEIKMDNVVIYPNPFNDYLFISKENDQISEVVIRDVVGKMVVRKSFNDKLIKIDMNELSAGSYIVTVRNNNQVTTKQIVK